MKRDFLKRLQKGPVVFDGATGTMLQRLGLKPGGCPDELSLKEPALIKKVHSLYKSAGVDVVSTNTFGANRIKLREYNLENKLAEINIAAGRLAREAVGEKLFVAGDIGPTGSFIEPVGDMSFETAVEVFTEQALALKKGGVDLIIIETMMDIKEVKAAVIAAKSTGLPVAVTMTFDETMRTVLGTPPESFAIIAASLGADLIGANCSLGVEGIFKAITAMSKVTSVPFIAQPNAGMPVLRGKETVFPASPDEMAAYAKRFAEAGVRALGGCCGTTPEHIKKMGAAFKKAKPKSAKTALSFTSLASRTSFLTFGGGLTPIVIGERINPTGRKALAEEIRQGLTSGIRNEARTQASANAHALDVNVGVPGINEPPAMKSAVFAVNENTALPLVIDSSNPLAMEAGLKAVDGKAIINSVSGEVKKLKTMLPLAKKYGGALLALTLDDKGIPSTAEGRLKVAEKIVNAAAKIGIEKEDIIIDCLAMTVSADAKSAVETLRAIRLIKEKLGCPTVLGVSNISFGLPAREVINANFLTMAIAVGLDAAIINPSNKAMSDAYHAACVLVAKDTRAEKYINRFKQITGAAQTVPEKPAETLDIKARLKKAVIEGDENNITALVEEALKEGLEPITISNDALVPGLEEVGRLFACNAYFLPQVMLSAETMKKAFTRLKKELKGAKGHSLGKVLLATVEGDIHDIGKNIVATLLENHGFEVIDLGKNVPKDKIVKEAIKNKVDVVGLSALMTTTVTEMELVIGALEKAGIKAAPIVGGAVVTEDYAKSIRAAYGGDAVSAVDRIKRLVKGEAV
ncbi:5-methyltetrahydrofolate--homocysteine methyltransferase [bacterium]|nr:MAG: 5-methyltetrahydrofolate--homocysteine methyltransferase [bacterium]